MALAQSHRLGGGPTPARWQVGSLHSSFPRFLGASGLEKRPWGSGQDSLTCTPSLASLRGLGSPVVGSASLGPAPSLISSWADRASVALRASYPLLTLQELLYCSLPQPRTPRHSLEVPLPLAGVGGSTVPELQQALYQLPAGCHPLATQLHLVLKLDKFGAEVLRTRGDWVTEGSPLLGR